MNPKQADKIFKRIQQKANRNVNGGKILLPTFNLKAKYEELALARAKQATDWVYTLSEQCHIVYICVGCWIAPIKSCYWLRCAKQPDAGRD